MSEDSRTDLGPADGTAASPPATTPGGVSNPGPQRSPAPIPGVERRPATPQFMRSLTKEVRDGDLGQPMHLTDFMFQLGLLYDLPQRVEPDASGAVEARRPGGTRKWLVVTAVLVVIAGIVPLLFKAPVERSLPHAVRGEWRTARGRYAGRGFTLSEDRVKLDFGDQASMVEFPISEVRRRTRGDTTEFEVLYREGSGSTRFVFTYVESAIPEMHLSSPIGVIWTRAKDTEVDGDRNRVSALPTGSAPGQPRLP